MSKIRRALCTTAFLLAFTADAKSAPEIPLPAVSMAEAVALANAQLLTGQGLLGVRFAKPADYIPISARYTEQEGARGWQWEIYFAHPIENDHTARYAVTMDKAVRLLSATQ